MSKFEVLVDKIINVEKHPNADRLSIVTIRGFNCISANVGEDNRPRYKIGDLVIYVPEDTIIPEYLLKKGWFDYEKNRGVLSGKNGDRVKSIKLRGIISTGILFSVDTYPEYNPETDFVLREEYPDLDIREGLDVSELLGFKKYEPQIPLNMAGDVTSISSHWAFNFDIENLLKYPTKFDNLHVIVTEKLHGTFTGFGYIKGLNNPEVIDNDFVVFSKGLGSKGLVFKNNENTKNNLYIKMFNEYGIKEKLIHLIKDISDIENEDILAVWILGETYGKGVQDLQYSENKPIFRWFDIVYEDVNHKRKFIDAIYKYDFLNIPLNNIKLYTVPILYNGIFNREIINELASGTSTLDGKTIREGVVITPYNEQYDNEIGRLILKLVSKDYTFRKGDVTEYQ